VIFVKKFDETEGAKTKSLLRKHLIIPRLKHPDFVNNQVLEEIERQRERPGAAMFPLRGLAWSGVFALLIAGLLATMVLPGQWDRPNSTEFISQVVTARAEVPQLSVSEFRAPDSRGIVIWIEGFDYIPAEDPVR
jgi:hypothetical protein